MSSKKVKLKKFREKRTWKEEKDYKKKLKVKINRRDKFCDRNIEKYEQ